MSIQQTQEITCTQCGNLQHATIWTTVNVTLNPEMRDVTINQQLNVFCCDQCGYKASMDVSFLYHDMDRKYAIQYINLADMKSEESYQTIRKDGTYVLPSLVTEILAKAGGDYLRRPHVVFSMNELICYIVFRDFCEAWGTEG